MGDNTYWLRKIATALGMMLLFTFLDLHLASACPGHLQCANFTGEKRNDCNYAAGQGFSREELQDVNPSIDSAYLDEIAARDDRDEVFVINTERVTVHRPQARRPQRLAQLTVNGA